MKSIYNLQKVLLLLLFVMSTFALNAQASADNGKTLFRNYCAQCHDKTMKKDLTGPALAGYEERWADYPEEDLYSWIRNSQALIASGHPRANELWGQWGTIMTAFPNLTDEEIASIKEHADNYVKYARAYMQKDSYDENPFYSSKG